MNKLIDCVAISDRIKAEVKSEVELMEVKPCLCVVQVGNDKASSVYVNSKERVCKELGIDSIVMPLNVETTQEELEDIIITLNARDNIHGILVQLPLPKHLDEKRIINLIHNNKDVDGLTTLNAGKLVCKDDSAIVSCTPLGVMEIFKELNYDLEGKDVTVVGRSLLFGLPMVQLLQQANATVTLAHSRTKGLDNKTFNSDVVICAIGKPKHFDSSYFNDGTIAIDVGINRDENGKLCGDIDVKDVMENCYDVLLTPTPRGSGAMTVAMLMKNVVKCAKLQGCK